MDEMNKNSKHAGKSGTLIMLENKAQLARWKIGNNEHAGEQGKVIMLENKAQ
jgi:hypothetical protein